jgi:signal transduction histidine kinase
VVTQTDDTLPLLEDVPPVELRRMLNAVYRAHRLIAVITDLDTLLRRIMEQSKEVAQAEACSLMLFDEVQQELYFKVTLGESGDQEALKTIRLKLGEGVAGVAAQTRQSIVVQDVTCEPRFLAAVDETTHFHTRCLLAVPLLDRDRLLGVLEVLNKVGGEGFTPSDLYVMEMFSALASSVIANAYLIERNLTSERLAAIGLAVAGLSHHTKNILTSMNASTDLIDHGLQTGSNDLLHRGWPILKRSVHRIANLVEDMLSFSKARVPVRERCRIPALIDDVKQSFDDLLAKRQIALEIEVGDAADPVYVDSRGLHRCLLNLLVNAADAVDAGTGLIRLRAATTDMGALLIEIEDNGPGIAEDMAARIFDPFFSTKGAGGTGLGLAVTQKIIHEHGGGISVGGSKLGGAAFRMVLPPVHVPADAPAGLGR